MAEAGSQEHLRRLVCNAIQTLQREGAWPGAPVTDRADRPVVTAREVEAASGGKLVVPTGAVVTPEARDRAQQRGVRLVHAPARPVGTLSSQEQAVAERLAAQLARDLPPTQLEELACWCWNEGSCADPVGIAHLVRAGADRVGLNSCSPPLDDAIAPLIDHTLLKPEATEEQVRQLCAEAIEFGFASVCVNPYYVRLVADSLTGTSVRTCTVIGFPLGASLPEVKAYETQLAVDQGAREIDMVINLGALKSGRHDWVLWDMGQVVETAHPAALVKVILETALLTDEEVVRACELARDAGAEFVKTSTGFGPGGATVDHVALMRKTVGRSMGVKASGGIGTRRAAAEMIAAGATRIGASAGVRIVRGD